MKPSSALQRQLEKGAKEKESTMAPSNTFRGRLERAGYPRTFAHYLSVTLPAWSDWLPMKGDARGRGHPKGRRGGAAAKDLDWLLDVAQTRPVWCDSDACSELVRDDQRERMVEFMCHGGQPYPIEALPGRWPGAERSQSRPYYRPVLPSNSEFSAFRAGAAERLKRPRVAGRIDDARLATGEKIRRLLEAHEPELSKWLRPGLSTAPAKSPPPELVKRLEALLGDVGVVEAALAGADDLLHRFPVKRCDGRAGTCRRWFRPDSRRKFCDRPCSTSGTTRRAIAAEKKQKQRELEERRRRRGAMKPRTSRRGSASSTTR